MSSPTSKRFSFMNLFQSKPKYHCDKCKVTVHEVGHWLEHFGHDSATDALVLEQMDSWVNEHPTPDEVLEDKSYFEDPEANDNFSQPTAYDHES